MRWRHATGEGDEMRRFVRDALAPLGFGLAVVTVVLGAAGYYYAAQRDGQLRGFRHSTDTERVELAARYQRGAEALGELSTVLVQIGLPVAVLTLLCVAGSYRVRPQWLPVATVALLAVFAALGLASRAAE